MAYARIAKDSDVYVYEDYAGFISCCGCRLLPFLGSEWIFTAAEMVEHLRKHEKAGHKVPPELFDVELYGPDEGRLETYLREREKMMKEAKR